MLTINVNYIAVYDNRYRLTLKEEKKIKQDNKYCVTSRQ